MEESIETVGNGRLRSAVLQNSGANCQGSAPSDDSSNFATDNTCAFATSQQGLALNPMLGPLTFDTFSLTHYHMPLAGSPLINMGANNCLPLDQRGALRPDACDIGAVEFGGLLPRLFMPYLQR